MALMNDFKTDLKTDMTESETSEKFMAKDYVRVMEDAQASRAQDVKSKSQKEAAKALLEGWRLKSMGSRPPPTPPAPGVAARSSSPALRDSSACTSCCGAAAPCSDPCLTANGDASSFLSDSPFPSSSC